MAYLDLSEITLNQQHQHQQGFVAGMDDHFGNGLTGLEALALVLLSSLEDDVEELEINGKEILIADILKDPTILNS